MTDSDGRDRRKGARTGGVAMRLRAHLGGGLDKLGAALPQDPASMERLVVGALLALALAQILIQSLTFYSPDRDDAQVILWAQAPRLAAGDQPTLLSNLAWLANQLGLSPHLFLIVMRQVFIVGAVLAMRAAVLRLGAQETVAWLAGLSILLLPDVHRNGLTQLTHTPFMIFALPLAFYAFAACATRPSLRSYVLFGLAGALLFHAKHNAALFLPVMLATALIDPLARSVARDRRILLSLAIVAVAAAPVGIWGLMHESALVAHVEKYDLSAEESTLTAVATALGEVLGEIASNIQYALLPLLLGLLFGAGRAERPDYLAFLWRYCLIFLIVALAAAGLAEVGMVKRRWIIPGALFAVVAIGAWAAGRLDEPRRRALIAVFLTVWLVWNVNELRGEFGFGEKRGGRARIDYTALMARLDDLAAPGERVIARMPLAGAIALERPDLKPWAGELAWPEAPGTLLVWPAERSLTGVPIDAAKSQLGAAWAPRELDSVRLPSAEAVGHPGEYVIYRVAP